MCHIIHNPQPSTCPGFLQIDPSNRLIFDLDPSSQAELRHHTVSDFETFLHSTPRRDARLRVGVALALNIIHLGLTPLLPSRWTKKEIVLLQRPGASATQPYLTSAWSPARGHNHHPNSKNHSDRNSGNVARPDARNAAARARESIFMLGVTLLELLFGSTLEAQPSRAEMLNSLGQANEYTDLCTALKWQQRAEEEFGNVIADAIRRCIVCGFDPVPDLESGPFVQAVWSNVVRPMEEFLAAWGGGG
jgi:hypothetical protein